MTLSVGLDDIIKKLAAEFVGTATEAIHDAEAVVKKAETRAIEASSAIREIARIAHSLKGQGGSFGFSNLTLVAHRLEDYLSHAAPSQTDFWPSVLRYLDRMAKVVDGELPQDSDPDRALSDLPVATLFDGALERRDIEVVLVSEGTTQNRLIREELEACGFRVTVIPSSLQAFSYVAQVKPKLMMATSVLPGISGIDLIKAVRAMAATRNVACILTTSAKDAERVAIDLPKDVPVARKGASFATDLAIAIERVGLV